MLSTRVARCWQGRGAASACPATLHSPASGSSNSEAAKALCTATARSPDHRATHADWAAWARGWTMPCSARASAARWRLRLRIGPQPRPQRPPSGSDGRAQAEGTFGAVCGGLLQGAPGLAGRLPQVAWQLTQRLCLPSLQRVPPAVTLALVLEPHYVSPVKPENARTPSCGNLAGAGSLSSGLSVRAAGARNPHPLSASSPAAGRAQRLPHRALPAHPPTSVGRDCLRAQPPVPFCPACSACPCQPQPMLMETRR